jgi:hypothetical protein
MPIQNARKLAEAGKEKYRVLSTIELLGRVYVPAPGVGLSEHAIIRTSGRIQVHSFSHGQLVDVDETGFIELNAGDAKAMLRCGAVAPLDAPPAPLRPSANAVKLRRLGIVPDAPEMGLYPH